MHRSSGLTGAPAELWSFFDPPAPAGGKPKSGLRPELRNNQNPCLNIKKNRQKIDTNKTNEREEVGV